MVKDDGNPYVVYTPYSRKWMTKFSEEGIKQYPSEDHLDNLYNEKPLLKISLDEMGFEISKMFPKDFEFDEDLVDQYGGNTKFFPQRRHLVWVSTCALEPKVSENLSQKVLKEKIQHFLKELIWREFLCKLWHFSHTENQCFKKQYDRIEYRNNEEEFEKWCQGEDGLSTLAKDG